MIKPNKESSFSDFAPFFTSSASLSISHWRDTPTSLPTDAQLRDWPLHTGGGVQTFHEDKLLTQAPTECAERIKKYEHALFYAVPLPHSPPRVPSSNLTAEHLALLTEEGVIEPVKPTEEDLLFANTTVCFVVPELRKQRLRVILWTKGLNQSLKEYIKENEIELPLPRVTDVLRSAAEEKACFLEDLTAAFWQRSVPKQARSRFAFWANNRCYRFTRLPMGTSISCHILQEYSLTVALGGLPHQGFEIIGSKLNQTPRNERKETMARCLVYIDNIKVEGPPSFVQEHAKRVRLFASECGVSLSERDRYLFLPQIDAPTPTYDFLGVVVKDRRVRVRERCRAALVEALRQAVEGSLTLQAATSMAGRLVWAAAVSGVALGSQLRAILGLRWAVNRANRGFPLDSTVSFSPAVLRGLIQLVDKTGRSRPAALNTCPRLETITAYADASRGGWGVVLLGPPSHPETLSFGGRWTDGPHGAEQAHINVLESWALLQAAAELQEALNHRGWPLCPVSFRTDSTAVLGAVNRAVAGRASTSPELAAAAAEFLALTERWEWNIEHVDSARNLADGPSRGKHVQGAGG